MVVSLVPRSHYRHPLPIRLLPNQPVDQIVFFVFGRPSKYEDPGGRSETWDGGNRREGR